MKWDEPLPAPPGETDHTLGDWLTIVQGEGGWDNDDCYLVASKGESWEPGIPMRVMSLELVIKTGLATLSICSTQLYDEGSRV